MTPSDDTVPLGGPHEIEDPAVQQTAAQVHQVMHSGVPRPAFRDELRARLVAARAEQITALADTEPLPPAKTMVIPTVPAAANPPAVRRRLAAVRAGWGARGRRARIAWAGGVGLATAAAVVAGVAFSTGVPVPGTTSVAVRSDATAAVSLGVTAPVRLEFSRPLDHRATERAIHLQPYARVSFQWQGDALTVTPQHGFAPNAAYVLTIDRTVARTATGAALARDLRVVFGTAGAPGLGTGPATAVALPRQQLAAVRDGSEAVVTRGGAVLFTGALPSAATGYDQGLVRVTEGAAAKLAGATDAICVSRSGNSIAYLSRGVSGTAIVFADSSAAAQGRAVVAVDSGSPLGWIGDTEVSFVSAGRLQAVDRAGHVRPLSPIPVAADADTVVLAPGGRYAYLKKAGAADSAGRLVDLQTQQEHGLPGIVGEPAFSADGATVIWVDGSGAAPRIASAASGGGPMRLAALPVAAGDQLSDVALAPDAAHFVYSVTHADHSAELRLAVLPSGATVAVSTAGAGASPNWSPSGRRVLVVTAGPTGSRVDEVSMPGAATDPEAALSGTATAFADAQLSGDGAAQAALATPGLAAPEVSGFTRAALLWVLDNPNGTASARLRLTSDAQPDGSGVEQIEETLTLQPDADGGPPLVRAASATARTAAPKGPQLRQLDTDAVPGSVLLAFDSDLDPGSVPTAIQLSTADGRTVPATVSYDAGRRVVTVRPDSAGTAGVVLHIGTGLRDAGGRGSDTAESIPLG